MDDFTSEDDILTFEGWAKYQGSDPAAMTPEELKEWRGIFDEVMERRKTSPKLGLMKLERRNGEQRYAVVIRDASDLWLTFWVRCSPKGEIFLMYPRADPGNPRVSYHLDGALHQKSHSTVGISQKRQPLTAAFRGSEHLGLYSGHGTKSIGAVFDREAFDGVVTVELDILGLLDGAVGVDLVEPGYEPEWDRDIAPRYYLSGVHQREVFREMVVHQWRSPYNVEFKRGSVAPLLLETPVSTSSKRAASARLCESRTLSELGPPVGIAAAAAV